MLGSSEGGARIEADDSLGVRKAVRAPDLIGGGLIVGRREKLQPTFELQASCGSGQVVVGIDDWAWDAFSLGITFARWTLSKQAAAPV